MSNNLEDRIRTIMTAVNEIKEKEGRGEKARLLAIAATHLETAKLFIREAESL